MVASHREREEGAEAEEVERPAAMRRERQQEAGRRREPSAGGKRGRVRSVFPLEGGRRNLKTGGLTQRACLDDDGRRKGRATKLHQVLSPLRSF